MADAKVSALTALTTPADEDLFYVVDDPGGTPTSKKITFANLQAGIGDFGATGISTDQIAESTAGANIDVVNPIHLTQDADGADAMKIFRQTDAGSPSGTLLMGMNAAGDDEFWRFDADGDFYVVDEDASDTFAVLRSSTAVELQLNTTTASLAKLTVNQSGTQKLKIDSDGALSFNEATVKLYSDASNSLKLASGDKLSLGIDVTSEVLNIGGNILGANVATDNTIKFSRYVVKSYSNEEESVFVIGGTSASDATATITVGGGSASYNAATTLEFYTAATPLTTTGTQRMEIGSGGTIAMGDGVAANTNYQLSVTSGAAARVGVHIKAASSATGNTLQIENNAGTKMFAIGPSGQIKTDQAAANTNTPSGATAYQLPVYDEDGSALGYIPVYGAAWS